jgi:hypothetical protein
MGLPYNTVLSGLKRLPKADIEAMKKLQAERIEEMRLKVWAEISGRQGPDGKVMPSEIPITELIDRALKIERHEGVNCRPAAG